MGNNINEYNEENLQYIYKVINYQSEKLTLTPEQKEEIRKEFEYLVKVEKLPMNYTSKIFWNYHGDIKDERFIEVKNDCIRLFKEDKNNK